jgi:serine/threonine protein kinase
MVDRKALEVGSSIGEYTIERVLGAGGLGMTYLVSHPRNGHFALKECFPNELAKRSSHGQDIIAINTRSGMTFPDLRERVIKEASTLLRFSHPSIVRLHHYFLANNTVYLVMSYVPGRSFRDWLRELGRRPTQAELDGILAPLLEALHVVHRNQHVHRDVAPDNIILRSLNDPVLLDFGSARSPTAAPGKQLTRFIKEGYSPPEFYDATPASQGPWSDIYSTAATLYEAVTGNRTPDGSDRQRRDTYITVNAFPCPGYRPAFLHAIDRALALDPRSRPRSIPEWREMLNAEAGRHTGAPSGSQSGWDRMSADTSGRSSGLIGRIVDLLR